MKEKLKKILCFILVFVLVLLIASIPFYKYRKYGDQFLNNRWKIEQVQNERQDTFDVMFLGDSTMCMGYSPLYLFKEFGISSYNCGTPFQWMKDSYDILKMVQPMQHMKVLVLDINNAYLPFNQYTKFIKMQIFNAFPIFHYHSMLMENNSNPGINDWKGFHCYTQENPGVNLNYMESDMPEEEMPWLGKSYLEKIREFCAEKNISLVLTAVPNPMRWNSGKSKAVEEWAQENNIAFIDGNKHIQEIGLDGNTDYMDAGEHVNLNGSTKWMKYLGAVLKQQFDLKDYRGTDYEKEWDRAIEATGVYKD